MSASFVDDDEADDDQRYNGEFFDLLEAGEGKLTEFLPEGFVGGFDAVQDGLALFRGAESIAVIVLELL